MNPDDVTTWTQALRYLYEERVGINTHIPQDQAEEQARVEVWTNRGELF